MNYAATKYIINVCYNYLSIGSYVKENTVP